MSGARSIACRTAIFAPGVSERMMAKALGGPADAVVLDLEDSVPVRDKPEARRNVVAVLAAAPPAAAQSRIVRVNNEGEWDVSDVEVIRALLESGRIQGVMIPKVSSAAQVDSFITAVGRDVPVWAVATETPEGVVSLVEIAQHPAVQVLCWGPEDLAVLMGSFGARDDTGRLRPVYEWVRWQTLVAARAAGIEALDTVFVDYNDSDGLAREAKEAADAGFSGKMAIHPAQLPVIEAAFSPPRHLVEWSVRLLAEREATGLGAFTFDGKMVDQPHFKLAARVLEREGLRSAG